MTRRGVLWSFAGLAVAGIHFSVLYGFTALACARGFAGGIVQIVGWGATALALTAALSVPLAAGVRWRCESSPRDVLEWLTIGCAATAAVTIVLVALPLALVPICD